MKTFNLVTEPWIKLDNGPAISLQELFSTSRPLHLGGSPIDRFVVFRLLLAICQRALPLEDGNDWDDANVVTMKKHALSYIQKWKGAFNLYDEEKPFLQFPQIKDSKKALPISNWVLGVSAGNATILNFGNVPKSLSDAEKAYVLLNQAMFPLRSSKADSSISLKPGYKKGVSALEAPALGRYGYLHSYVLGKNLLDSLYLNLVTEEDLPLYLTEGLGIPPWEQMPKNEDDDISESIQSSYIGRLIPLSRFCLIQGEFLNLTDGIHLPGLDSGCVDLSVAISKDSESKSKFRALNARLDRLPWRQMDAILSYVSSSHQWSCYQLLKCAAPRHRTERNDIPAMGIWSVGLQVNLQFKDQFISASDGYVDSEFHIPLKELGEEFYSFYTSELEKLDKVAKALFKAVSGYFVALGDANGRDQASRAVQVFWAECNMHAVDLQFACQQNDLLFIRRTFSAIAKHVVESCCPKTTARQIFAWANNQVHLDWYLKI